MHEEERAARRVPPVVVEHDGEDGDVVALRDPVDGAGHAEEVGAVADDLADELGFVRVVGCEFDAKGLSEWLASRLIFRGSAGGRKGRCIPLRQTSRVQLLHN